jgi:hypothetical protein
MPVLFVCTTLARIQPESASVVSIAVGRGCLDASGGFVQKVMAFQSYYVFNTGKIEDLRVGAAILKEAIDRETEKEERAQRNREDQKAVAAAAAQNVRFSPLRYPRSPHLTLPVSAGQVGIFR